MSSNGKGPKVAPHSAPTSGELSRMGLPQESDLPKSRSGEASLFDNLIKGDKPEEPTVTAAPNSMVTPTGQYIGSPMRKRPSFLAKQFRMISKSSSADAPKRNIRILGKDYSSSTVSVIPAATAVSIPQEELEKDEEPTVMANESNRKSSGEPPIDTVTEYPTHAILNKKLHSLSRTPSLSRRSFSVSDRLSCSHGDSERSGISDRSIPETVLSSADYVKIRRQRISTRRSMSSKGVWTDQEFESFERRGELGIAGSPLGESRFNVGVSVRTDISSADSPARSRPDNLELNYSPDDTDSGVEMYHESTSAGPGSFASGRSSRSSSDDWVTESEDRDHLRMYGGSKHRRASGSSSTSSGRDAPRHDPISPTRNRKEIPPSNYRDRILSRQRSGMSSFNSSRNYHGGHERDLKRDENSMPSSSNRRDQSRRLLAAGNSAISSKVVLLLGKYGNARKGLRIAGLKTVSSHGPHQNMRNMSASDDDMAVPLDSISPQEAVAVFQDEVARMMLEEGERCDELKDVEDFLDGYMRLSSPFYVEMVEEFFRAVCVDCYKRPLDLPPVEESPRSSHHRSWHSSLTGRSFRSESLKVH